MNTPPPDELMSTGLALYFRLYISLITFTCRKYSSFCPVAVYRLSNCCLVCVVIVCCVFFIFILTNYTQWTQK